MIKYLKLMDESLREKNTERVHTCQRELVDNPHILEPGVSLLEELGEHGFPELQGDDVEHLIIDAKEVRVDKLRQAGVTWVVEEEVVPLGLGLPHHHVLLCLLVSKTRDHGALHDAIAKQIAPSTQRGALDRSFGEGLSTRGACHIDVCFMQVERAG